MTGFSVLRSTFAMDVKGLTFYPTYGIVNGP
jgi:hypothetical protein